MSENIEGRGADLRINLELTLEEAFHGAKVQVQVQVPLPGREPVTLPVPPGVDTGTRMRLSGQGERGRTGGRYGDLYIELIVRPHSVFVREDEHLSCELSLTDEQLATGGTFQVPALEGRVPLTVPAGTRAGTTFTLPERGMPRLARKGRGTLRVTVVPLRAGSGTAAVPWTGPVSQEAEARATKVFTCIALAVALLALLNYLLTC